MMQIIAIGLGAGLAAGLLFASVVSASPLAIPLFYLAPLPVLLAGLGWSHWSALIAAVIAAAGLGLSYGTALFLVSLLGIGLPAWWLCYLALLARPGATAAPESLEWYPVGRLVLWAAIIGALVVVATLARFGLDPESVQTGLRQALTVLFGAARPGLDDARIPGSGTTEAAELIEWLVVWIPRTAAIPSTITTVLNLWIAGRIVRTSGRLKRPWPDLSAMTFPPMVPVVLAAAFAATFAPGPIGVIAWPLAASLATAYMLAGFAVLHATTRGLNGRVFILTGSYLTVMMFRWPIVVIVLLGLIDAALDIRGRVARRRRPAAPRT